jgi:hypothetical protein
LPGLRREHLQGPDAAEVLVLQRFRLRDKSPQ